MSVRWRKWGERCYFAAEVLLSTAAELNPLTSFSFFWYVLDPNGIEKNLFFAVFVQAHLLKINDIVLL